MSITPEIREQLLRYQRDEITGHHIYKRLAQTLPSPENRRVIEAIAADELGHYQQWKNYTQQEVKPQWGKIRFYYWISRIFGFTFGIKLLERGEHDAQDEYARLETWIPEAEAVMRTEHEHEETLIGMLDEEKLRYAGSMVLGLNDALVELTGTLAGLTLAFQNTRLIALSGTITGIAAALSMAASEYLSTKSEETKKNPLKASLYTGAAYIVTVLLLILPYLVLKNYYAALAVTMTVAVAIIAGFNYYIAVAKDEPFKPRFLEMAGLSLSVAALSFGVGLIVRKVFGVEV
ncbi:MAG TPA: VIT1/CCC1 transporter family protein [Anaerolineae bacterium]|nr:VIT1/CCC1 transporter family protein [Anaerolineae bacterium]HQK15480.1 VIT1/CCC1 transporter family protein [Anaerolineae bacterium]